MRAVSTLGARGRAALLFAMLGASSGLAASAFGASPAPLAAAPYSLGPTSRCLAARGASVARVRPLDSQLRRLRDLAQRTSREARTGKQSIGLAFARNEAAADLLVELLTVPNTAYRLVQRRNVVLMYKPTSRAALTRTVECLRS